MKKFFYGGLATATMLVVAACNSDRLTVPNYQNPTPPAVAGDPLGALQLFANGILFRDRGAAAGYLNGIGRLGRESLEYSNTEGRNVTHYITSLVSDPTGFASGANFGGFYTELLESFNFKNTVNSLTSLTASQKSAALGFAHTFDALEIYYAITVRGGGPGATAGYGLPVDINSNPSILTNFVSRDSVYNFVIGTLDKAKTELAAGGTAFPFSLNAGFTGNGDFSTPANFLKFNRALAARVNAARASIGVAGCGAPKSAACYTTVLTNLSESFYTPTPANFTQGVYRLYSSAANDLVNGLSPAADISNLAHPSIRTDAQAGDTRVDAKTFVLTNPVPAPTGAEVTTNTDFLLYPTLSSSIPIVRDEELLLLHAEASWYTGATGAALADINIIRTTYGLPALGGFADENAFLTELLYERRYSLLYEGFRWFDLVRFNKLGTLPVLAPPTVTAQQVTVSKLSLPQAECLARALATGAAAVPSNSGC